MCCMCIPFSEIVDIVEVAALIATPIITICLYRREVRENRFYKLLDNWLHIKRNIALEIDKVEEFDIVTETIVGESIFHYASQEIEQIAKSILSSEYKGKWEFKDIDEYKSLVHNLWQDVSANGISVEEVKEMECKYISDYQMRFTNYKYNIDHNICGLTQYEYDNCVKEMSFYLFYDK